MVRARHLEREAEPAHGSPGGRLVHRAAGALLDPGRHFRRRPEPAVGRLRAQGRGQFRGHGGVYAGWRAGLGSGLLVGDGLGAALVVALGELRDPARGAAHAAGGLGGERAARDEVEGSPARLLVRPAAGTVALE